MAKAPVFADVDILVIGGTSAIVAACESAVSDGASVFLATPLSYLGEDIAGTYRLWDVYSHSEGDELADVLFRDPLGGGNGFSRPLWVKKVLEDRLLDAGVSFLYQTYFVDALRDSDGGVAGAVLINRSGIIAVRAPVVIDATATAAVARGMGLDLNGDMPGKVEFKHITVGSGTPETGHEAVIDVRRLPDLTILPSGNDRDYFKKPKTYPAYEYTLSLSLADYTTSSLAEAEQTARDATWSPGWVDSADMLFHVPAASIAGIVRNDESLLPYTPEVPGLYVLSGCADLAEADKSRLLEAGTSIPVGRLVGKAASAEAAGRVVREPVAQTARSRGSATVDEMVSPVPSNMRFTDTKAPAIDVDLSLLPVIGTYDVCVAGGGTGGAPAAIGAARTGASTLVIEYLHGLGGVATIGLITKYYHGNRVGFTEEVDRGVSIGLDGKTLEGVKEGQSSAWNTMHKIEWYRQEARRTGAEIWFGALGAGTVTIGGKVTGIIAATPQGTGIVRCGCAVDASGSADIAAAAGAECRYVASDTMAVQGTGLPPRTPEIPYTNTDYTFVDDTDIEGVTAAYTVGRQKYDTAFDLGQLIDSRERRQIVGDHTVTPMDIFNERTLPDTLVLARSNFDTHGFTIHPLFTLRPPDRESLDAYIPLGALLPKGIEGVLVTGLAVSADRDAMPVIRMQPDIQNQGYAAGYVAALAATRGTAIRDLDIRELQQHMVDSKILEPSVLTHTDSYPLNDAVLSGAVENVLDGYTGISALLTDPERSLPLVRRALEEAPAEGKIVYAHILAMSGDSSGTDVILDRVLSMDWDEGWNYRGMGQFGMNMSLLDSYIVALGQTGRSDVLPAIVEKAGKLQADADFSHVRAVSLAFEALSDAAATPSLVRLLNLPGIRGHAETSISDAISAVTESSTDDETRNRALKEIVLARALYLCGDADNLGRRILLDYSRDARGGFAVHAGAILAR